MTPAGYSKAAFKFPVAFLRGILELEYGMPFLCLVPDARERRCGERTTSLIYQKRISRSPQIEYVILTDLNGNDFYFLFWSYLYVNMNFENVISDDT